MKYISPGYYRPHRAPPKFRTRVADRVGSSIVLPMYDMPKPLRGHTLLSSSTTKGWQHTPVYQTVVTLLLKRIASMAVRNTPAFPLFAAIFMRQRASCSDIPPAPTLSFFLWFLCFVCLFVCSATTSKDHARQSREKEIQRESWEREIMRNRQEREREGGSEG